MANYAEVTGFQPEETAGSQPRQVRDRVNGEEMSIRARTVVNAGGVFAGRIEEMARNSSGIRIEPSKRGAPDGAAQRS